MAKIRNPLSFSRHFRVTESALRGAGVLNPVLNVDTKLFIDPVLLGASRHAEITDASAQFRKHFEDVIRLLAASTKDADLPWRTARRMLQFREMASTCLGYSGATIRGHGMGEQLTAQLLRTAKTIVDLGVKDPDLFKLLPLVEDGIGPDLISDLTTNVIALPLASFTSRICRELGVARETFVIGGRDVDLPRNPVQPIRTPVLLVPIDILRTLPIASTWDEVASVAAENQAARARLNQLIGDIWSAEVRKNKPRLRATVLESRPAIEALLDLLRTAEKKPYDLQSDPEGLLIWRAVREHVATDFPLMLALAAPPSPARAVALVDQIVRQFRTLVEDKGLWKMLWHEGKPHHEKVAQMVFFAVADAYCKANNLDVTPEAETGNGPVDFKFAAGYDVRVLVEVKLSTNSKLVSGYDKQLEAYRTAEKPIRSTYLVIDVGGLPRKMSRLLTLKNARSSGPTPDIATIDAKPKPSASKR